MGKKRRKSAESVANCLQQLQELTGSEGNYAYRGQKNADWGVESGALRRIRKTKLSKEDFISYHEKELLEPARMDGHGVEEGRKLKDLELLAKLQHHGAATCLIDFTRNFFVAMWFACESYKEERKEKNGKIFILDTSDWKNFRSLEEKDLEKKVRPILKFQTRDEVASSKETTIFSIPKPSWWHWSPHGFIERILKQDSLFVFGQPKMEGTLLEEIKISGRAKGKIREELEKLGITEGTLFKDLPGFADSHGCDKSLPLRYGSEEYYFRKGNEALQRDDLKGAMANYNRVIELEPDFEEAYNYQGSAKYDRIIELKPIFVEAYFNRGDAKSNLGDLNGAIADYDRVIELDPDLDSDYVVETYFNLGNIKAELGNHNSAIADYDQVIKLEPDFAEAYNNRGNVKAELGNRMGAIADYSQAIEFDPYDAVAYYNRGLAKSDLGNHRGAIADLNRAIKRDPDDAGAYNRRGIVNRRLDRHSEAIADYKRAIELKPDFAMAYYNRGIVNRILGHNSESITDFNRAIKHKHNYAKAYHKRGLAYDSLGDEKRTRRDLLKAKELAERSDDERLLGLIDKALSELDNENSNSS